MGSAQLTPIRKQAPAVSERAARVIEKAMEVQPAERYQSAAEFMAELSGPVAVKEDATVRRAKPAGSAAPVPSPGNHRRASARPALDALGMDRRRFWRCGSDCGGADPGVEQPEQACGAAADHDPGACGGCDRGAYGHLDVGSYRDTSTH